MTKRPRFDPYALFEALERHCVGCAVIGGFGRWSTGRRAHAGLDIFPSLREENLRHLANALTDVGASHAAVEALQTSELS